ncbi:N-acetylmuramoyl-L-alanine amidase, partial [Pontibacter sp. HJ8]
MPEGIAYLSREAWGAKAPVLPMRSHQLTRLTIHHTATTQSTSRSLADKMRALQKFSQEDSPLASGKMKPAWADIPYHLYVDVHGEVAEGRDIQYAGDSNTSYDPAGHLLVVVEGNFEKGA